MFPDFLIDDVESVAQRLLGCLLVRTIDGQSVTVRIVETEAYDQDDAASHTFRGMTARNRVMFGECGHLYVYFTYGMHYCCNVVSGPAGHGSGVLIRAGEPVTGRDFIEQRRGMVGINATNGPAKLCQALDINLALDGHDLRQPSVELQQETLRPEEFISRSPRIGISKAADLLRRFYITGNPYVSRGPRHLTTGFVPTEQAGS